MKSLEDMTYIIYDCAYVCVCKTRYEIYQMPSCPVVYVCVSPCASVLKSWCVWWSSVKGGGQNRACLCPEEASPVNSKGEKENLPVLLIEVGAMKLKLGKDRRGMCLCVLKRVTGGAVNQKKMERNCVCLYVWKWNDWSTQNEEKKRNKKILHPEKANWWRLNEERLEEQISVCLWRTYDEI